MKKLEDVSVIGLIIINCPFVILALGPMPPYGAYLARQYPNHQNENHHILLPETELDLVVLVCSASGGRPDPKITFFKDGSLIRNDLITGIKIDESMVPYNYGMLNISGKCLKTMQFLLPIIRYDEV